MAQDYKMKYMELRSRFVSSLDVAFRLGYQKGQQDGQVQQLQQQQQMQQQQMAQMQQQMQPGMDQQSPQMDQGSAMGMDQGASDFQAQAGDMQQEQGVSEIEQGIQELEELLNKGEVDAASVKSVLNLLNGSLHKIMQSSTFKKSEHIKRMNEGKEIFKQSAISHNKAIQAKSEESQIIQKRIVGNILKKWEAEEREASNDILKTLKVEGKIK